MPSLKNTINTFKKNTKSNLLIKSNCVVNQKPVNHKSNWFTVNPTINTALQWQTADISACDADMPWSKPKSAMLKRPVVELNSSLENATSVKTAV